MDLLRIKKNSGLEKEKILCSESSDDIQLLRSSCDSMPPAKKPFPDADENCSNAVKESMKTSAETAFTVSSKGCILQIYGFTLNFPEGALQKDTEVVVSVENDPENYPKVLSSRDVIPIAPILGLRPSPTFTKPVSVKIPTWFHVFEGQTVDAILATSEAGIVWKEVQDGKMTLSSSNHIEFAVDHFCKISVVIPKKDASKGEHRILNELYIQEGSAMMQSVFYLDSEKTEDDIQRSMSRKSYSSFSGKTLYLDGQVGGEMKISARITRPIEKRVDKYDPKPAKIKVDELVKYHVQHVQFDAGLDEWMDGDVNLDNYKGTIKGKYSVLHNEEEFQAILHRKWPIKRDPLVAPPIQITAHTVAMDDAQVQVSNQDTKNEVNSRNS